MRPAGRLAWAARAAWAVAGLGWFLWLGYEDRGLAAVMALAAALALAGALSTLAHRAASRPLAERARLSSAALGGLAAGAAVGPLAAVLMLVKVSLHGHAIPDFAVADVLAALARTPVWAVAGLMVGTAAGLAAAASREM